MAVTTTHRLPIFEPLSDPAKGEWIEIHDLSKDIKRMHSGSSDSLTRLDKLESICMVYLVELCSKMLIRKEQRVHGRIDASLNL
jgi:hypothetical protein